MASEIPFEGIVRALRELRIVRSTVGALSKRVKKLEDNPGTSDGKAKQALVDIAKVINERQGSGSGGKWTLADATAAIKEISTAITNVLGCLALCLCLVGCGERPLSAALSAPGPHGYTHFEDMDPDAEVLTYDEITNLLESVMGPRLAALQGELANKVDVAGLEETVGEKVASFLAGTSDAQEAFERFVNSPDTKAYIGSGCYVRWNPDTNSMEVFRHGTEQP